MRPQALAAQSKAELVLQLRRGENLIVTLAVPLGILVFFAKVDTTIPTNFKHPVDFLVPGVLSLAVMAAAMVSLGIATGFERRYGVLKRLGSTPLSRGGLLAAKTATVLVFELVEALLVVVTGVALGWHVPGGLLPAVGLLLVGTVAFAGVGLLMAGTLRAEANLAAADRALPRVAVPGRDGLSAFEASGRHAGGRKSAASGRALRHCPVGAVHSGLPDRSARGAHRVGGVRAAGRGTLVPLGGIGTEPLRPA